MNTASQATFLSSLNFVSNASVYIADHIHKHGDVFKLTLPFHSIYAIANPNVLKHILVKNEQNYIKSKIYWAQLRAVVGDALGTYEGEDWLWMKKLQMRCFTHDHVQKHLKNILQSNNKHFEEWQNHGQPINLINAFSELNVSILLKALFGYEHSGICDAIAHHIADGEETISWRSAFPWRPYTAWLNGRNQRYHKHLEYFDDLTDDIIRQNLEKPNPETLIEALLEASIFMKENNKINKELIRNELIIHLGAGTETAAVGMGWTFYLLHKHPHICQKVVAEIDQVIGKGEVTPEHAYKLPYTNHVLQEALRLYPPSHGLVRDAIEEDMIGDLQVKKGDTFFISSYALHRNPRFWKNPDAFIPERFEEEVNTYAYVPFGAGKHTCIGRFLAKPMMTLGLAQFLKNHTFDMKLNEPVIPLSLATLKPNQPLMTQVYKR